MALHGAIMVNGTTIALWSATRISPKGRRPTNDEVCDYLVTYIEYGTGHSVQKTVKGHRYGDGAATLLRKLLQEVGA